MIKFALALFMGIILGGTGIWYYLTLVQIYPSTTSLQKDTRANGQKTVEERATTGEWLKDKFDPFDLSPKKIQQELKESGQLVRRYAMQVRNNSIEAVAELRITAVVKTKLARDPELSAWGIAVSTTDGQVTISGKVESPELVGKAMLYALETEGVEIVISALRVEKKESHLPQPASSL